MTPKNRRSESFFVLKKEQFPLFDDVTDEEGHKIPNLRLGRVSPAVPFLIYRRHRIFGFLFTKEIKYNDINIKKFTDKEN